jgi:regulator of sigma E protease
LTNPDGQYSDIFSLIEKLRIETVITSLAAFIFVFSMIVLVHEFGHFFAARTSGVRVYEFSIGFPFSPRLCTLFRHRETEFTLRLLPLGGFVRFSTEGDEGAMDLFNAPPLKRAFIMSAGSLFNAAFAFIIFIPIFMTGRDIFFIHAVSLSAKTLWGILSGTVLFFTGLFSGHGGMELLSGPVGIAAMAGQAASGGLLSVFYFTGVLSVSLGIMNLFPLPALDGGQLLMLIIEAAIKRPLGLKTHQAVNLIGFALFLLLTAVVTYKDIMRMIA